MPSLKKLIWYIETAAKLGVSDVLYTTQYKFALSKGLLKKKFPVKEINFEQDFFHPQEKVNDYPEKWKSKLIPDAQNIFSGNLKYYSFHWKEVGNPPNWFLNPFNEKEFPNAGKHWTALPDFGNIGDIKNVWEASRFDWAGILSRAYMVTGEKKYLETLNAWILDWFKKNPYNIGPNWKCGQETSFKLFSLLNAAHFLRQDDNPIKSLVQLIELFLERIEANIKYAITQRNNHGTSEAAALYIGGNWLASVNKSSKEKYLQIAAKGKTLLEKLVEQLIYSDGSFSQHSVTYHRVLIDTLSIAAFWQKKLSLPEFSSEFKHRVLKAGDWLFMLTDSVSGYSPNLGSNDGSLILNNHSCDYRDFRPSIQTFFALYKNEYLFEDGDWDEPLYWFNIEKTSLKKRSVKKESVVLSGGYVVMQSKNSWAVTHFPFFRFRPNQNDVFHFDLWYKGKNLLIDSGSYSYNPGKDYKGPDMKSVHSHNTVSFDGGEQMPRISKFLLAKWIKPNSTGQIKNTGESSGSWIGSYKDYRSNYHERTIEWNNDKWTIADKVSGPAKSIQLGFSFYPSDFTIEKNSVILPWGILEVSENASVKVIDHSVSLYYWQSQPAKRIVISSQNNSTITTKIILN